MHDLTAAADYSEAARLDPQFGGGNAHNNLGTALIVERKFEEAIQAFSAAIALNPQNAVS